MLAWRMETSGIPPSLWTPQAKTGDATWVPWAPEPRPGGSQEAVALSPECMGLCLSGQRKVQDSAMLGLGPARPGPSTSAAPMEIQGPPPSLSLSPTVPSVGTLLPGPWTCLAQGWAPGLSGVTPSPAPSPGRLCLAHCPSHLADVSPGLRAPSQSCLLLWPRGQCVHVSGLERALF